MSSDSVAGNSTLLPAPAPKKVKIQQPLTESQTKTRVKKIKRPRRQGPSFLPGKVHYVLASELETLADWSRLLEQEEHQKLLEEVIDTGCCHLQVNTASRAKSDGGATPTSADPDKLDRRLVPAEGAVITFRPVMTRNTSFTPLEKPTTSSTPQGSDLDLFLYSDADSDADSDDDETERVNGEEIEGMVTHTPTRNRTGGEDSPFPRDDSEAGGKRQQQQQQEPTGRSGKDDWTARSRSKRKSSESGVGGEGEVARRQKGLESARDETSPAIDLGGQDKPPSVLAVDPGSDHDMRKSPHKLDQASIDRYKFPAVLSTKKVHATTLPCWVHFGLCMLFSEQLESDPSLQDQLPRLVDLKNMVPNRTRLIELLREGKWWTSRHNVPPKDSLGSVEDETAELLDAGQVWSRHMICQVEHALWMKICQRRGHSGVELYHWKAYSSGPLFDTGTLPADTPEHRITGEERSAEPLFGNPLPRLSNALQSVSSATGSRSHINDSSLRFASTFAIEGFRQTRLAMGTLIAHRLGSPLIVYVISRYEGNAVSAIVPETSTSEEPVGPCCRRGLVIPPANLLRLGLTVARVELGINAPNSKRIPAALQVLLVAPGAWIQIVPVGPVCWEERSFVSSAWKSELAPLVWVCPFHEQREMDRYITDARALRHLRISPVKAFFDRLEDDLKSGLEQGK